MCVLCEAIAGSNSQEEDPLAMLLNALTAPVVDYFEEYRTEAEATLTGESPLTGPWEIAVAKVGGGTTGKEYPVGEQWIIGIYTNGDLVECFAPRPKVPMTHEKALGDFAFSYFGYVKSEES